MRPCVGVHAVVLRGVHVYVFVRLRVCAGAVPGPKGVDGDGCWTEASVTVLRACRLQPA